MLGKVIYEIETELRELESSFSSPELDLKSKEVNFHMMCRFVSIANEALTCSDENSSTQISLLTVFYGSDLCLDGCFHPILKNIYDSYFITSGSSDIEDAYLNTELQLWIHDDICDLLSK